MGKMVRLSALFILIILGCGCAKTTLVALVPDPDGRTGQVSVSNAAGSVVLDAPNQATTVGNAKDKPGTPAVLDKDALSRIFAEAISIQPKQPTHYLLYFEKETTLTADSMKLLPEIISAIRERKSTDISVVGHTDTVGSREFNLTLSINRANAVKDQLVRLGAESNAIQTVSHGKENPLIKTGDNVSEPRNRRVEVVVR